MFVVFWWCCCLAVPAGAQEAAWLQPFGAEWPQLDGDATGEWWKPSPVLRGPQKGQLQPPRLMVCGDACAGVSPGYHDHGVLNGWPQLYPLLPDEPWEVQLEF
ncbi:MAG UNVERIFIED_CONTAM: hypothetical protein LVR18_52475 [Planctomycetaceae bacterium]